MPRKKTHEEFVAEVKALVGDEFTVESEYNGGDACVLIKHTICGESYKRAATQFLKIQSCKVCAMKRVHEGRFEEGKKNFITFFNENMIHDYDLLSEYQGSNKHLTVRHKLCGKEYNVRPSCLYIGKRCRDCAAKERGSARLKTQKEAEKDVYTSTNGEYTLVGKYIGSRTKTLFRHECGYEWNCLPTNILRGIGGCPECSSSKGEKCVRRFLQSKKIQFKSQERLQGCVYKRGLPFDFVIYQRSSILCAIEYDGQQHFSPINFGSENAEKPLKEFKTRKICDAIKNKYCADNGIPLIRIPYWEYDNIDAILTEKLLPLLADSNAKLTDSQAS